MSGGGSSTTTSSSTVPPQFLSAYDNTVNRATSVAKTPYQSYNGQLVAGFTPQQTQAQGEVADSQGNFIPALSSAGSYVNQSTAPLWSGTIQSGVSPTSGIAGYTPNLWGSTAQSGVASGSGIAGYNPNYTGSMLSTGVSPSSGVAGYTPNSVANAPGVNASTIGQYESPYQSQVIAATQAQEANSDAQQQTQLAGSAASAGAFGGDRMGVAQGVLGGQQALANNSTLAGLNQSNYAQALGEANTQQSTGIAANEADTQIGNSMFNQQQAAQLGATEAGTSLANSQFDTQQAAQLGANEQGIQLGNSEFNTQQQNELGANEANSWLNSQAGYAEGNLANETENLSLGDASALSQSGLTQQQQNQAGLNTSYEQWQAQQAFPYQQTGWLANITEGIGSNVGGNSTTTQTNNWTGGRIPRAGGGIVPQHFDGGGGILSEIPNVSTSYIPSVSGSGGGGGGRGIPNAPSAQVPQNPWANPTSDIAAAAGATSLYKNLGIGSMFGGGGSGMPSIAGSTLNPGSITSYDSLAGGVAADGSLSDAMPAIGASVLNPASASVASSLAPTTAAASAAAPGFWGAIPTTFSGVGDSLAAAGTDLGSGALGIGASLGDLATAGAGAIASGGTWLLDLLGLAFKDGGAVEQPQHHAHGGIVLPFPQDRVRRASGGITGSDTGMMPYENAPPVQLNGTTGMPGYMGGIASSPASSGAPTAAQTAASAVQGGGSGMGNTLGSMAASGDFGLLPMMLRDGGAVPRAFGGGIGGGGGNTAMPYGGSALSYIPGQASSGGGGGILGSSAGSAAAPRRAGGSVMSFPHPLAHGSPIRQTPEATAAGVNLPPTTRAMHRGGIVGRSHFADGGAPDEDVAWSQPDTTDTAWSDSPISPTPSSAAPAGGGITGSAPADAMNFTPEKPSGWLPLAAGVATAALGRHANAGRNIAEGVLAGLGSYDTQQTNYAGQQEKAASIAQAAKRMADDAEFHKEEIAREGAAQVETARHNQAAEATAAQEAKDRGAYERVSGQADLSRAGSDASRAATDDFTAHSLADYRTTMAGRGKFSLIGSDPNGNPIFGDGYSGNMQDAQGNPYSGPLKPTSVQQGRLDNQSAAITQRADAAKNATVARQLATDAAKGNNDQLVAKGLADSSQYLPPDQRMTYEEALSRVRLQRNGNSAGPVARSSPAATVPAAPQQAGQPAAQSQSAPAAPPGPQAPPAPGTVVGGYRYTGGDPNAQGNWAPISSAP